MNCAWQELLHILPPWLRDITDQEGRKDLQELRLRIGQPPDYIKHFESVATGKEISHEDIYYVVNTASRYSPWSAATISRGYITAPGGHRVGICGDAVMQNGTVTGIRTVRSLCIRVSRDFPGIANGIPDHCSVLIIGPPGAGKTTLLRDLIRQRSNGNHHSISVVDERGELFPKDFDPGKHTDIYTGCSKEQGITMALRTMGPGAIAVDEITEESDAAALIQAGRCGVELLATAHAAGMNDIRTRPIYRKLLDSYIFQWLIILKEDKSWRAERITQ